MVLQIHPSQDIWIFGYGSLMWNPGFEYLEAQLAYLDGYRRDLCILSHVFRGTPDCPGLVMGLVKGGKCHGRAFRVKAEHKEKTLTYLHEREMINNVYTPSWVDLTLDDGRTTPAFTYISRPDHPQFASHYSDAEKIKCVLQGVGQGGTALEYLQNTLSHLHDLNLNDSALESILHASLCQIAQKSDKNAK